jgi:hypothetical protein
VSERLRTPEGAAGCLRLFAALPELHKMLADHLTAEFPVEVARTGGRKVEEWKQRPGRDNHLFDCFVGCAVAASIGGLVWSAGAAAGQDATKTEQKKPVKWSELQRAKRAGR